MTSPSNTEPPSTKAPSHHAYHVRARTSKQAFWMRIGSAWQHFDNKGFTLHLDTAPFDGRIVLRLAPETSK